MVIKRSDRKAKSRHFRDTPRDLSRIQFTGVEVFTVHCVRWTDMPNHSGNIQPAPGRTVVRNFGKLFVNGDPSKAAPDALRQRTQRTREFHFEAWAWGFVLPRSVFPRL